MARTQGLQVAGQSHRWGVIALCQTPWLACSATRAGFRHVNALARNPQQHQVLSHRGRGLDYRGHVEHVW
jgi:hypothetical protein